MNNKQKRILLGRKKQRVPDRPSERVRYGICPIIIGVNVLAYLREIDNIKMKMTRQLLIGCGIPPELVRGKQ